MLKRFLTPAGLLATVTGLWLPWADVRCGQVRTEPDFWQLAKADDRMYLLLVPVAVIVVCVLWSLWKGRRTLAIATTAAAIAAIGGWCYLWFKKDEMAAYQAQLAGGVAGDLAKVFKDVEVVMGSGYKLYLAGALLALAGAALELARRESESPLQERLLRR